MNNILKDLRKKALEKETEINSNPNSSIEDKKLIKDTIEFLKYEDSIRKVPKSTVFSMFRFLGYTSDNLEMIYYNDLYNQLMDEINEVYILADEDQITRS